MANLNVTYGDMQDVASRLVAGKEDINSKLAELQAAVNALVDAGFQTDSASGAFQSSYDSFTSGITQAVSGLDGMSSFLTSAADALANVDTELGAAIRG
jgi:WXG100 family type VII secretion target